MILPVSVHNNKNINFGENKKEIPKGDTLLKNNFSTRARIGLDKFTKAFTIYPARGMKGSINSDFYEFLTMGTVPYVIGSATLMGVFNYSNKVAPEAAKLGKKMALGVLLYGLFKSWSKSFINLPVKWITGIDTQLPYLKVNHQLPENKDDFDLTSYEYHKVGESVEFTRWDLLYGDPDDKKSLNAKYDKIAKRNGLGTDLNDSDQEVKPMYREVLVKSTLARSLSSYLWAAVGVGLAFQDAWDEYFNAATLKFWEPEKFKHSMKVLGNSIKNSAKNFYKPEIADTKLEKYAGKTLLFSALALTVLGILNTIHITQKPSKVKESDVINKNKESVVG